VWKLKKNSRLIEIQYALVAELAWTVIRQIPVRSLVYTDVTELG